tara:strand:+ start:49 stop:297 length:249 start_codon:yes stop_codon:yes gene_type:complete
MKYLCDWDHIHLPVPGRIKINNTIKDVIIISKPSLLREEIVYYEVDKPMGYKIIKLNDIYSIEGYDNKQEKEDNNNNISIQG